MDNISSGTNKPGDTVTPIGRDLSKETHGAIDQAANKAQPTADKLASAAHGATDKIANTASKVGESLSTKGEKLSTTYKQYAEQGRGYVRASPAISVLVAMAAGYGLSKLLNSRK